MRVHVILKSLLISYVMTGVFLFALALAVFRLNLGQIAATIGILMIYVAVCFIGSFLSGKRVRKKKSYNGFWIGLGYFVILFGVSCFTSRKIGMTPQHALTTLIMCTGGGMLGGILS